MYFKMSMLVLRNKCWIFVKTYSIAVVLSSVFLLGGVYTAQAAPVPIQGYAWSDYLGGIHFNGSTYGVIKDSVSGALSGYAWSEYISWITFNQSDLAGCPSGTCKAEVNTSTGVVTGWARACAAFSNKATCSGALESGAGGWDGWIHLGGTALDSTPYGVTSSAGCWTGYAWGSNDIGAINFSGTASDASTYKVGDTSCFAPVNLSSGAVTLSGGSLVEGNTLTFSSNVINMTGSPTPVAFSDNFTYQWNGTSGVWQSLNTISEAILAGNANRTDVSSGLLISQTGVLYIQHCIDSNGEIMETDESVSDNCKVQSFNIVSGSISASITDMNGGGTTTITWSSTGVTSACIVSSIELANTDSWSALSGTEVTAPLYESTTYTLVCDSILVDSIDITVTTSPELSVDLPIVEKGGTPITLSWDTNNGDETLCSLIGGDLNYSALPTGTGGPMTGSVVTTVTGQTEYTLSCPNFLDPFNPHMDRITVELLPNQFET
jgi:hypothetical protein